MLAIYRTIVLFAAMCYAPSSSCGSNDIPIEESRKSINLDRSLLDVKLLRQAVLSELSALAVKMQENDHEFAANLLRDTMPSVQNSMSKIEENFRDLIGILRYERSESGGLSSEVLQDIVESAKHSVESGIAMYAEQSRKELARYYAYNRYCAYVLGCVGCYGVMTHDVYIMSLAFVMVSCLEVIMFNGFDLRARINSCFRRTNELRAIEMPLMP